MIDLLILLALGLHFHGINGSQCGAAKFQPATFTAQRNLDLGKRIVGGIKATPGSWPWQVMLKNDGEVKCGGSIISRYVILTAAHCLEGETDLNAWGVYVGKYHKGSPDQTEKRHTIKRFIPHEEYNTQTLGNDIGLIFVKEPIEFTEYVQPVCYVPPKRRPKHTDQLCFTTGWGNTKGTGHNDVLKEVELSPQPLLICRKFMQQKLRSTPKRKGSVYCAGYQRADACYGDSGGPHSCKIGNNWYIKGIVSSGLDCGQPGWYGLYINVWMYTRWINEQITIEALLRSLDQNSPTINV